MSLSALVGLALGQAVIIPINPFNVPVWSQYGGNPQHTSLSTVPSGPMQQVLWTAPTDFSPQYSGSDLLTHYGTPTITTAGTVILPIKTGSTDGFEFVGITTDGNAKWGVATDYSLPPHGWIPSCAGALSLGNAWYVYPGTAASIWVLTKPDNPTTNPVQTAFYGFANYTALSAMDKATVSSNLKICTPLLTTPDSRLYYGFRVLGALPPTFPSLQPYVNPPTSLSGFVQGTASGMVGLSVSARAASGDSNIIQPVMNCAPALSNDGKIVYVVVSSGNWGYGYLLGLSTHDLSTVYKVRLKDPDGNDAPLPDDGTASPMVGPDGDVYFGVLENPFPYNHDRGWMLHFNAALTVSKTPGAFGWDDTPSVVPSKAVPSYVGPSKYLILTKYNNYAGVGGDGHNRVGILDPNQSQIDPITGNTVMKPIITVLGATPDPDFPGDPGAVREWCINAAAIDPINKCAIVNSEDGRCYRWNFVTNALDHQTVLTSGVGEAYTPTVIGLGGTVLAINNATLFAIGPSSLP